MKETAYFVLRHPKDHIVELARVAHAPIIEKGHSLYMTCNNALMTGFTEFNMLDDDSFVEFSLWAYKMPSQDYFFIQSIEDWLRITFYFSASDCFLSSEIVQSQKMPSGGWSDDDQVGKLVKQNTRSHTRNNSGITKKASLYLGKEWLNRFFVRIHFENTIDCLTFFEERLNVYEFFEIERTHSITGLVNRFLESSSIEEYKSEDARKQELQDLVIRLVNLLLEKRLLNSIHQLDSDLDRIILSAKYLLSYNFKLPPPSLEQLSKMTCMNRDKFQKLFKSYYNKTFYQFFQEARFLYAKDLLHHKGVSVQDAASLCGYKHITHFVRSFEKASNSL